MTLPEDRLQEAERAIRRGAERERRILERIRRAVRSLQDVRRKLARDRRAHTAALNDLRGRGDHCQP